MDKNSQEISLKDIVLKFIIFRQLLMSRWYIIVIAGISGGLLGITYSFLSDKTYTAEATFALEEKSGAGGNPYAGIASQFGIDLGKSDGGLLAGDNILELIKSRKIVESALLTEVEIAGKKDLLINRYGEHNELLETWTESGVVFSARQKPETFSIPQDSILANVYTKLKPGIAADRIDKKIALIKTSFQSTDEVFAKLFLEIIIRNVSEFYVDIKTRKTKANIALLESRLDSVQQSLAEEMYGAAISQDQNQNPIRSQVRIPAARKQMNVQILTTLYGELTKNLELSKMTLMREEPLVQVVDGPKYPLPYKKPGKTVSGLIGGILGGLLSVLYVLGKNAYSRLMKS